MQNQASVQRQTAQDPDAGWKPSNRPQSTVALNFMDELDTLFNLDNSLDTLDKTIHEKKQAVNTQAQELEALQRRLREAEERLSQATGSPLKPKDSQPATAAANSPLAARHPQTMDIPGMLPSDRTRPTRAPASPPRRPPPCSVVRHTPDARSGKESQSDRTPYHFNQRRHISGETPIFALAFC
ncbi:hypothetical protein C7974DRAFT_426869 [Boeremia exigua]|uniref:uncharacterized protein n=1 Tax=Boeremia exigua TaxID=749465 RepID=UPI001E8DA7D3|nr:uncharacterized protein C7974DRAFT_426869 [Boeremia exigua]KAH6618597.1 hypothetical protein C7974DRAFT_426869 [Boeremia exigua]